MDERTNRLSAATLTATSVIDGQDEVAPDVEHDWVSGSAQKPAQYCGVLKAAGAFRASTMPWEGSQRSCTAKK